MSKRLLVVDDEPNLLRAVGACLRGEGFDVVTARSGAEALVRVAETVPDLVVSDVRMPGMDGYQLARLVGSSQADAAPHAPFYDEALTEAEVRVAEAVARGLSNKEIAAEFRISVRTVENHISHILAKKGFGNRVEIARYVLDRAQAGEKS
ncbi:MAG TPA: response regulator transcription factor [Pyrinomonadaceae bacterium]|nr:response regulator transcription factor [Pyrinomonadaceae bacterium]